MGPYEDLMREGRRGAALGEDFEARVLGKIRRKKRQRRRVTVMAAGLGLVLGLGIWFLAWGEKAPKESLQPMLAAVEPLEEVPLLEEIVLSPSGQHTEYPLELVSLSAGEGGM